MSAQKTKEDIFKFIRMRSNSSGENPEAPQSHTAAQSQVRRSEAIPGNQLTQDQQKIATLLGGGQKTESLVLGLHGFRINDNP